MNFVTIITMTIKPMGGEFVYFIIVVFVSYAAFEEFAVFGGEFQITHSAVPRAV